MEQTHVESFLDDGWSVIGRLHQWLSRWPQTSNDELSIDVLIRGLQRIWSASDDLGLKQLSRTLLALEQMLERFCAGTLVFSPDRMQDFTNGLGYLQELLLGFEATREEPTNVDLNAISLLERHILQAVWVDLEKNSVLISENNGKIAEPGSTLDHFEYLPIPTPDAELNVAPKSVERTLLKMLEQFVVKLDDTCRRLHAKMLTDETPYATTTSRLEHLAEVTRELVDQILMQPAEKIPAMSGMHFEPTFKLDHVATSNVDIELRDVDVEDWAEKPSEFSEELADLTREIAEIHPDLPIRNSSKPVFDQLLIEGSSNEQKSQRTRILIVEGSLFYRHLISMAVQLAGYEYQVAQSVEESIATLESDSGFGAIVVDSTIASDWADAVSSYRRLSDIPLIGLTTSNPLSCPENLFDDCAPRSHPQKLIAILNQYLNDTTDPTRKIA